MSQHMDAFAVANAVKLAQTQLRRELSALPRHEARARLAEVLRDPSDLEARFRVDRLMSGVPWFGPAAIQAAMALVGCSRARVRVGELTARQRGVLADWLVGLGEYERDAA